MGFEEWLEQTIKILKIRLSNYNLNVEELTTLINFAYERVISDTYISKKTFMYRLDCECAEDECNVCGDSNFYVVDLKDNDIRLLSILGVYDPKGNRVDNYKVHSPYKIEAMFNTIEQIPYITVYRRYRERIDRFDVDLLTEARNAIIEFVVYQMRDSVTNISRKEVRDATLSKYYDEIEVLNSKFPKFAMDEFGYGGLNG
jgi:hypothetical protein